MLQPKNGLECTMRTSANTVSAVMWPTWGSDTVSAAAVENQLELSGGFWMWNKKVSHRILFDLSQNDAIKIPSD